MLKLLKVIDDFFFKIDDEIETEATDKKFFYVPLLIMFIILVIVFIFT